MLKNYALNRGGVINGEHEEIYSNNNRIMNTDSYNDIKCDSGMRVKVRNTRGKICATRDLRFLKGRPFSKPL